MTASQPEPSGTTGRVVGTDKRPKAARVRVFVRSDSGFEESISVASAENGEFVLPTTVRFGSAFLVVQAAGHAPYVARVVDAAPASLDIRLKRELNVRGRVLDEADTGVADVRLQFRTRFDEDAGALLRELGVGATTDASGEFSISVPPLDDCTLVAKPKDGVAGASAALPIAGSDRVLVHVGSPAVLASLRSLRGAFQDIVKQRADELTLANAKRKKGDRITRLRWSEDHVRAVMRALYASDHQLAREFIEAEGRRILRPRIAKGFEASGVDVEEAIDELLGRFQFASPSVGENGPTDDELELGTTARVSWLERCIVTSSPKPTWSG